MSATVYAPVVQYCREMWAALAQMMAEYAVMQAWGQVNWRELHTEVTTLFAKAFTWQHLANT